MKRILLLLGAFALVLAATVVFTSNTDVRTATVQELSGTDLSRLANVNPDDAEAAASSYYIYPTGGTTYEIDTITDVTNDTVTIPVNLLSNREGCWWITSTNISGTTAVIARAEEASYIGTVTSAFDWFEVARDTIAATAVTKLCFDRITGYKMRLILDGYTGTQSTRFRTKFSAKPQ